MISLPENVVSNDLTERKEMDNGKGSKKKLRIGLLLDSFDIPAWAYMMLKRIIKSDYGEITLVVLNDTHTEKQSWLSKLNNYWSKSFYRGFRKLEDMKFNLSPNAFEIKDSKILFAEMPMMKVNPRKTKFSDEFKSEDIEKIKSHEIDVFIRLGFRILEGQILKTARFGVWSYYPGVNQINEGVPAGLWEVLENEPTTYSILQILTEDLGKAKVIYRSYSSTDMVSVNKTCNKHYWKILSFIPRKLEELYTLEEKRFLEKVEQENKHIDLYPFKSYSIPNNNKLLKPLTKYLMRNIIMLLYRQIFFEQWILLFDLNNDTSYSFWRYKKIIPPKDRLWADPHIIYKEGKYYIFIEEKLFRTNKGHISLIIMNEKGHYEKPVKIIDKPYHMSYPFVFEWNGECYMIPETASNKTIEIYKCVRFPDKWEFQHNLMEGIDASDATLFYFNQKWWLFVNISENDGCTNWDELFLFYSNSPLSDRWRPHPQSPIISDVRKARPAGKIFQHNGNIYRPSQNSSNRYGYGLKINQIVKLNEIEYDETEVNSLEPNWEKNIKGIHSFSKEEDLTVIDGKLKRLRNFKR